MSVKLPNLCQRCMGRGWVKAGTTNIIECPECKGTGEV